MKDVPIKQIKYTISVFPHEQLETVAWAGCSALHAFLRQKEQATASILSSQLHLGTLRAKEDTFLLDLQILGSIFQGSEMKYKVVRPPSATLPGKWTKDRKGSAL